MTRFIQSIGQGWLLNEIKIDKGKDLFAATPPLESKKMLFSWAVTEGIGFMKGNKKRGMKLDFIDARRAYFHAEARRQVFVELCEEDAVKGCVGNWSKLCMAQGMQHKIGK